MVHHVLKGLNPNMQDACVITGTNMLRNNVMQRITSKLQGLNLLALLLNMTKH
jgi:hypothetical protein